MSEKDRKKAERDRKRQAEREKQENKKRFSLTPEKKRALKLLIMKIAAEQLAEELARKEKAKKDFLDSRVKPIPPDLASLNEAQLVSLCKDIHAQITIAEEERYTAEMKIRKTDYDVYFILFIKILNKN
jgi:hypothetical protein